MYIYCTESTHIYLECSPFHLFMSYCVVLEYAHGMFQFNNKLKIGWSKKTTSLDRTTLRSQLRGKFSN